MASGAAGAGVLALADADAAVTLAAGADLATLAAAAAVAGFTEADALALAGVCANALPINTVEAISAVMILFMIVSLNSVERY